MSRGAPTAGSPTKVAQALYQAINRHDFDAGFALLDPGFVWIEPDQALLGGRQGFDEIRAVIEAQLEVFDHFTIEAESFHEHDDRVAVPVRQRATGGASGVELEIRIGHLWTVRDGKAFRLEVFPAREDAERAVRSADGDRAERGSPSSVRSSILSATERTPA